MNKTKEERLLRFTKDFYNKWSSTFTIDPDNDIHATLQAHASGDRFLRFWDVMDIEGVISIEKKAWYYSRSNSLTHSMSDNTINFKLSDTTISYIRFMEL